MFSKNRRLFMLSATALLVAAPLFAKAKPVNIILVMADDLGIKELGSYGQKKIKTPHLDQMAKEGMRFTQFYAGAPVCAPTHCNLMTGKHAGHAAIRANGEIRSNQYEKNGATIFGGQTPLPAAETTIAEVLKAKGYATGCFGKWGLGIGGSTGDPLKKGFDRFYGYNCQRNAHSYYPPFLDSNEREVRINKYPVPPPFFPRFSLLAVVVVVVIAVVAVIDTVPKNVRLTRSPNTQEEEIPQITQIIADRPFICVYLRYLRFEMLAGSVVGSSIEYRVSSIEYRGTSTTPSSHSRRSLL